MKNNIYLALGDSYTIGHNVPDEQRFPQLTANILNQNNFAISSVQYIAANGWTTEDLQSALDNTVLESAYSIVSLLIGVNDQYAGNDIADYRMRFTNLLVKSIALTENNPSRVFVLSIPDYSVTPFVPLLQKNKVSAEVDAYNKVIYSVTKQYNCHYVDVTGISKLSLNDRSLLSHDDLHPSGKQYELWAKELAEIVVRGER